MSVYAYKPKGTQKPEATDSAKGILPHSVYTVLKSSGRALDPDTGSKMRSHFGYDFSKVRVHTGSLAATSARAINAAAYTVGNDVVVPTESETVAGSRLLAHELAHVVQQAHGGHADTPGSIPAADRGAESEAGRAADAVIDGRSYHPRLRTGVALHRQPAPGPPATLSGLTATRDAFNNSGAPDPDNCAVSKPAALGVDGPRLGQNGMEMIFKINGVIPPGTEFEITRTRASGLWQQDAGAWTRVSGDPAGTSDDHHDDDECHTPANRRIFVVDTPGLPGTLNPTGIVYVDGGTIAATATAAVRKFSFAEWVIARNRGLGIGWQRISTPTFHRWHSITSVALVGGTWTRADTPSGQHNEIELGSIATTNATP